ncbi:uridine phosphorylase, putative [Eimeria acervulina]|uniref:Uridine phosphorylase, putative n=1 Tax=Eimeria acervulina TaxID=5801 RepID=U6GD75_EIMAC|nr:uridine phosphorylase, putative [Eimeria acervulina]CDI77303.1 uridine phosphorylase, putative [Eimeria acervulina]
MGAPNMDFLVRESSYLFKDQPMAFVRVGTCGIFKPNVAPGALCLADKIYYCQRNYSYFDGNVTEGSSFSDSPYLISGPVKGDEELIEKIKSNLGKKDDVVVLKGPAISAETFYSCQGRRFPDFSDENKSLVDTFVDLGVIGCEMESHQLYHLCKQRTDANPKKTKTRAASVCLGVVNRVDPSTPAHLTRQSEESTKQTVLAAAGAALDALISLPL